MADTLPVALGERSYTIHFETDSAAALAARVSDLRAAGRRSVVVTDTSLQKAQAHFLRAAFGDTPVIALDPGEESKSLAGFSRILDFLAANKIDRAGVVFAVGGGVIGDLAGFAAAAWLRGIDFIQVPTTLLAMVDSSVGGKTGINHPAGKNLVGAFHQPRAVCISTEVLRTLPKREFAAGAAEIIKYGLLGDAALFTRLESVPLQPASADLADVIRRCCAIKAGIVEADERETAAEGGRALLNLGHTFGHAIENAAGYGDYLHGEAVAIGLCAAARLSQKLGFIGLAEISRIERTVAAHQLPVRLRAPLPLPDLEAAMGRDKKVRAGGIRFIVLRAIGDARTHAGIDPALVAASFREVGATT